MKTFSLALFALALLATAAAPVDAAVKLASPFTDHMVLQRELPVPIWGTADPDEKVTVEFAGQNKAVEADASGKWRVTLDPLTASAESRSLKVSGGAGAGAEAPLELKDVLVGEVWIASGQSNMDFTVAKTPKFSFAGAQNEAEEVAAANYPLIRAFRAEPVRSYEVKSEVPGAWQVCNPENVREFSAIGYFFARDLQKELKVPVGILTLTYGASTAQAWVRREVIETNPKLKPVLDEFDAKVKNYHPPTEEENKQWQVAADQAKAEGKRAPRRPGGGRPEQDQHNPTVLYNGVVAPVVPFAARGVIWYQGESITDPKDLFPLWNETLIKDWRQLWGRDLPFYFCQLAGQDAASNSPAVREMQTEALKLPNTAMAVLTDIGERKNVHPKNKQDVGDRLSRIALAKVYGRKIEWSGPTLESAQVEGGKLRLKFSHADGGLVAKDGPALKTFEIAGADGKYVPAEAAIDGDAVVVQAAEVPAPVTARYAWLNYPAESNLYNKAGLPAAQFRTDKLPGQ